MPTNVTPFSWAIQSRVTLCRVSWDDSYKDVVSFASPEKRNEYFDSLKKRIYRFGKLHVFEAA